MPRSYGRFTTSIWLDPDFTSLTLEQQGAYFTLGLQPDVTAAGVLPYTSRRWSKLSDGTSRERFEQLVALLAEHSGEHLLVDEDTEEVLIRKFIKWDMGWANTQKRLRVVLDAVDAIASARIRAAAVGELRKIPASGIGSPEARDALSRELQIRYPPNLHTVTGSDRVVVTTRTRTTATHNPETATLEREPATEVALSPFCKTHPDGTTEPCAGCARARTVYDRRSKAAQDDAAASKAAAASARTTAIRSCPRCDDNGFALDSNDKAYRCNHHEGATA